MLDEMREVTPRMTDDPSAGADGADRPVPVTVRVPIDRELALQRGSVAGLTWRYAYARSADCRRAGQVGQDFLTIRCDGRAVAFAVCDGVGQSFFGEIAAGLLGSALLDWLWAQAGAVSSDEDL